MNLSFQYPYTALFKISAVLCGNGTVACGTHLDQGATFPVLTYPQNNNNDSVALSGLSLPSGDYTIRLFAAVKPTAGSGPGARIGVTGFSGSLSTTSFNLSWPEPNALNGNPMTISLH